MNTPYDTHDARDGHNAGQSTGIDALLDERLHAYFTGHATEPLVVEAFWQRLAPAIEQQAQTVGNAETTTEIASPTQPVTDAAIPAPTAPGANSTGRRRTAHPRRVIGNLLGLAAVLTLCLSAFALFHQQGSVTPGAAQTIQRGELTWEKVKLPPGVVLADGEGVRVTTDGGTPVDTGQPASWPASNATLRVAPSNGAIAYICQITTHGVAKVWRTDDAGQQWSSLPTLPGGGQSEYNSCGVAVDANNPDNVVVGLGSQARGGANTYTAYAFFAGATQWKSLPQGIGQFASWNDTYYAVNNLGGSGAPGDDQRIDRLYVSTDRMQTWQEVNDAPLIAENLAKPKTTPWNGGSIVSGAFGVEYVWVQPKTGELLAQTHDGVLWRSNDHARHWTRIILPALPPATELTPTPGEMISEGGPTAAIAFVQQPTDSKPFTLCTMVFDQQPIVYNVAPLYCSNDSGETWTRRPRTAVDWHNGKPQSFELPSLMLADGELLAWDVQSISIYPGVNTSAPAARVIGAIPPPRSPNNIPGGKIGVTADGVALWQPWDPQTLYVAVYTTSTTP